MKGSFYVFVFGLSLVVLIGVSYYYSVKEVFVEGAPDIKGIERLRGRFLPLLDEESFKTQLLQDNPSLTSVKLFKTYPHSLYISVRKLRPILAVQLADGYVYISEKGTVLEKNRSEVPLTIPIVTYYQPLFYNQFTIGEEVAQDELLSAAAFMYGSADEGIRVTKIDITNENMIVLHTDSFEILITSTREIEKQLTTFVYTIRQLRQQDTDFKRIDVRFEKPVIKL